MPSEIDKRCLRCARRFRNVPRQGDRDFFRRRSSGKVVIVRSGNPFPTRSVELQNHMEADFIEKTDARISAKLEPLARYLEATVGSQVVAAIKDERAEKRQGPPDAIEQMLVSRPILSADDARQISDAAAGRAVKAERSERRRKQGEAEKAS